MVLLFLLILAFLSWGILAELEKDFPPQPAAACTGCGGEVDPELLLCPTCRTFLRKTCRGCGKSGSVHFAFCPWCGTPHGSS